MYFFLDLYCIFQGRHMLNNYYILHFLSNKVLKYPVQFLPSSQIIQCGSKQDERYDSTGLLTDKKQLIYRRCTCTVQCGGVHPDWFDGQQGCSQLSTGLPPSSGLGWEEKRSEVQPLGRCPLTGRIPRLWRL
jgi:hypothetical protein